MTSRSYVEFVRALENKADATRETYDFCFKNFLRYIGLSTASADSLLNYEARSLEDKIKDFIQYLINGGKSYSTQNKHMSAIQTFCKVNRIRIDWLWLSQFLKPDKKASPQGKEPYTTAEIEKMLRLADLRTKAAMLIMYTGGARIGALPVIREKDLHYIESQRLWAITLYAETESEYVTFLTPQASQFVASYISQTQHDKARRRNDHEQYVFLSRRQPNPKKPISTDALAVDILKVARHAGIREIGESSTDRKAAMLNHAFRKAFRTQLRIAGIKDADAEDLIGHKPKLIRTYDKPTPEQRLETTGYVKAISYLTVANV